MSALHRRTVTRCNETNLCNGNADGDGGDTGGGSAILIGGKDTSGAAARIRATAYYDASLFAAAGFSMILWGRRPE